MEKDRGPDVPFPPPVLFLGGYLIGLAIEKYVRRVRLVDAAAQVHLLSAIGYALIGAGLVISAWGALTFTSARTPIAPMRPAATLVEHGPYRFTRNPMYGGLTLVYIGASFASNMTWPLVLLPFVLWALIALVIVKEERHLADAFGEQYLAYRRRVRRWL